LVIPMRMSTSPDYDTALPPFRRVRCQR
jgi:hypothetical protein